jgi:drug/metabolite transporter (DMT)-like permease
VQSSLSKNLPKITWLKPYSLGQVFGVACIVAACLCWALDALWRYPLLQSGVNAVDLVFYEHLILFVIFLPFILIAALTKKHLWTKKMFLNFLMVGALGSGLSTVCFSQAMFLINPTVVIVLQKLQPFVSLLLAKYILSERLPKTFLYYFMWAVLGIILMSYQDILMLFSWWSNAHESHGSASLVGYSCLLFSILGWSCATIYGKKIFMDAKGPVSPVELMALRYMWGLVFLSLVLIMKGEVLLVMQRMAVVSIASSIIPLLFFSAILGMYFYYKGVEILRPRRIVVAEMWYPLAAMLVNHFYLHIYLNMTQLLGALLLIVSSILIQHKRM